MNKLSVVEAKEQEFVNLKGFVIVKKLMDAFPEIEFCVHGGSAAYLHALNVTKCEIELHDIDVLIRSNHSVVEINKQILGWLNLNYKIQSIDKDCDSIYYVNIGNIILNFFINELQPYNTIEKVFEINVISLRDSLITEKQMLVDIQSDIDYCTRNNTSGEETQFILCLVDKIRRKREFVHLMTKTRNSTHWIPPSITDDIQIFTFDCHRY